MSGVGQDNQQRRAEADKAKLDAQAEVDELLWLMSDAKGRRFVWRLLDRARIYQPTFVAGSFDVTAFNEGRRNEGLRLLSLLNQHCPGRMSEMLKEARNHERRNSK